MFYVDDIPVYGRDKFITVSPSTSFLDRVIRATVGERQFYPHAPTELPYEAVYQIQRTSTADLKLALLDVEVLTPRTAITTVSGTVTYQADGPFIPPGSSEEFNGGVLVGDYVKVRIIWDLTVSWSGNLVGYKCQARFSDFLYEVESPLEPITAFNRSILVDVTYDRLTGTWTDNGSTLGNIIYQRNLPNQNATEFVTEIEKSIYPDGAPFYIYGSRCCVFTMKSGVLVKQYRKSTGAYIRSTRIKLDIDRFEEEAGLQVYSYLNNGTVIVKPQLSDLYSCSFNELGRLKETIDNG